MADLDDNDCRFLNQMRDSERKLLNSIAPFSREKPFTAETKYMSILKLIRLGLLTGEIGVEANKTLNYANITFTEEGKRAWTKQMLIGKCLN
ncbi:hypothetical protein ACT3UM_02440 [Halomonas sp. AOP13-D3-9]